MKRKAWINRGLALVLAAALALEAPGLKVSAEEQTREEQMQEELTGPIAGSVDGEDGETLPDVSEGNVIPLGASGARLAAQPVGTAHVQNYQITVAASALSTAYNATSSYHAALPAVTGFFDNQQKYNVAYLYKDGSDIKLYVDRYDSAMQKDSTLKLTVPSSYTSLGAIVCDENGYYYAVWGRTDTDAANIEVIDVRKYDYNGGVIADCAMRGEDLNPYGMEGYGTKDPFHAGSCRAVISNGVLACNYARLMYSGHQSNHVIYINTADMTRDTSVAAVYCSHSFDQRIIPTQSGTYLVANQGDAYSRGFQMALPGASAFSSKGIFSFHFREGANRSYGYNETFAQLGGIAETADSYVLLGSSERTLSYAAAPSSSYCGHNEARDLFIQFLKKDFNSYSGADCYSVPGETRTATGQKSSDALTQLWLADGTVDYGVIWLTELDDSYYVNNPHVVVTDDDKVVVMWERHTYGNFTGQNASYYAILNADGTVYQDTTLIKDVQLAGNTEPVYKDGKIYWTTVDGNGSYIHALNLDPYDSVVVSIRGNKEEVYYDTKEHTVSGYTVSIDNSLYTENDFSFSGSATVSGTEVGTYVMELDEKDFVNQNAKFKNVTFHVTDGELKIIPKEYTVKFVLNGGTIQGETLSKYTQYVGADLPANVIREGYDFQGWYTSSSFSGDAVTRITAQDSGNKTFYAKWTKKTYTITLDTCGGPKMDSLQVEYNGKVVLPADPLREEYSFAGWYLDREYTIAFDAAVKVTESFTLYARWIAFEEVRDGIWVLAVEDQIYTGSAIKPAIQVYDGETLLIEGKDYKVSYKNNVKANDASVAKKAPLITVTGKGNYTNDKATMNFAILRRDISTDEFSCADLAVKTSNKVPNPVPVLFRGKKKLANKKDFKVTYYTDTTYEQEADLSNAGTYYGVVEGIGNYCGKRYITLAVTSATLIDKASVSGLKAQTYREDGTPVTPDFTVKLSGQTLRGVPAESYKADVTDADYTYEFEDNAQVGTAKLILKGVGAYAGTKTVTFTINGIAALSRASVSWTEGQSFVYTGGEITPATTLTITVNGESRSLVENRDYTTAFRNNVNAGTATIIYTGLKGYSGTLKTSFKIAPCNLENGRKDGLISAVLADGSPVYVKGGATPRVEVQHRISDSYVPLQEKTDYTVTYQNNNAVTTDGTAKLPQATVRGKGNYTGTVVLTYAIRPQSLGNLTVKAPDKNYSPKAGAFKSVPVLQDTNGKKLAAGKDYDKNVKYYYAEERAGVVTLLSEVNAQDTVDAGTLLAVRIQGLGNYADSEAVATYRVISRNIASLKASVAAQVYTGKPIELTEEDIVIKDGTYALKKDTDYVITGYSKNIAKGTATVTIQGIGNYGGTKTLKFKIGAKKFLWFVIG